MFSSQAQSRSPLQQVLCFALLSFRALHQRSQTIVVGHHPAWHQSPVDVAEVLPNQPIAQLTGRLLVSKEGEPSSFSQAISFISV